MDEFVRTLTSVRVLLWPSNAQGLLVFMIIHAYEWGNEPSDLFVLQPHRLLSSISLSCSYHHLRCFIRRRVGFWPILQFSCLVLLHLIKYSGSHLKQRPSAKRDRCHQCINYVDTKLSIVELRVLWQQNHDVDRKKQWFSSYNLVTFNEKYVISIYINKIFCILQNTDVFIMILTQWRYSLPNKRIY